MSHSTRVRGLKHYKVLSMLLMKPSHSTRVRGLKPVEQIEEQHSDSVALYTSAWIETTKRWQHNFCFNVALYTSAWIETQSVTRPEPAKQKMKPR